MLPIGIKPGEIPTWHKLDEFTFQKLSRDIFEHEPDIVWCNVYGVRGQAQNGIDLLAQRAAGDGIEVAQCKCYKVFSPADIKAASDEFFAHLDYWTKKDVRRFVLIVASDLSRTGQVNEIGNQKERFSELNIDYEAWSASTITNKLRPHPGIVSHYLVPAQHWVETICGHFPGRSIPTHPRDETQSVVLNEAVTNQLSQLMETLTGDVELQLEAQLTNWREGRAVEVVGWIANLRGDATRWDALSSQIKARIICLEGRLSLAVDRDLETASRLADEAEHLFPSEESARLRALIAYSEEGPEQAGRFLEDYTDIDSTNLKAAMLLEAGKHEQALKVLDSMENMEEANDNS